MLNKRTHEDLKHVVAEDKPESVIRTFWEEAQLADRFNSFTNGTDAVDAEGKKLNPSLEEQYTELHPSVTYTDGHDDGGLPATVETEVTYVTYDETVEEPVLDENDMPVMDEATNLPKTQEVPVIADSYYELDDNNEVTVDEAGNKVLKEEYATAEVVESLELFKQTKIDEFLKEPTNRTVDMTSYVTFIKPILLEKVSAQFEKSMNDVTSSYPEHEQKTWDKQEAQALAYQADNTVATPILDGIVAIRGVDKDTLVLKVIEKAEQFTNLVSAAIGYRQKAEDVIVAAATVEDIEAVIEELNANRDVFNSLVNA